MESINLIYPANEDQFGTVGEQRNLVYPARDVFGNPIPVKSTMQVVWTGNLFICFPSAFDLPSVSIVASVGHNASVSVFVGDLDSSTPIEEDGDRDTEDAPPADVKEPAPPSKPKGKR